MGKAIATTGAGRRIRRACALLAASEGARVAANDPGVNPDGAGHDRGPLDGLRLLVPSQLLAGIPGPAPLAEDPRFPGQDS